MFSELAEISRNTSVISSSSSSSSVSDSVDARPVRPARTFAAPRSASDPPQSVRELPAFMQRELGVEPVRATGPSAHDFEFGEILGHGSYSTVIEARARKSGRVYAIKVLDKAHLQRHNQRRTAYAEKDALVVLGTGFPGVVGLYSTFSDAWSLCESPARPLARAATEPNQTLSSTCFPTGICVRSSCAMARFLLPVRATTLPSSQTPLPLSTQRA